MTATRRAAVFAAVFLALVFDGVELGLMPVASLSVTKSLTGEAYTPTLGGDWFARYTAALMLGAAVGGVALGNLGDRVGRARAMGVSILAYSAFAALGAFVTSQNQMLALRFLVGLGVGGLWPNGMALAAECWPGASKPLVSGAMMAGLNFGILALSQAVRLATVTPDSWRWLFGLAGAPALLGVVVLVALPESPAWLANRGMTKGRVTPLRDLFAPDLVRFTVVGILLSSVPMVGAWSAGKWMIPWADAVAGPADAGYKAATQGWWALGATLGSFAGAPLASALGRKRTYAILCVATVAITVGLFQLTAPLRPGFHAVVFAQGFVATLFFGWLALCLPEFYPTSVRATGSGLAYNAGRFVTAGGVFAAGVLFRSLGGDYANVGAICALVYLLGLVVVVGYRTPPAATAG